VNKLLEKEKAEQAAKMGVSVTTNSEKKTATSSSGDYAKSDPFEIAKEVLEAPPRKLNPFSHLASLFQFHLHLPLRLFPAPFSTVAFCLSSLARQCLFVLHLGRVELT
jgi:hypothetical protein